MKAYPRQGGGNQGSSLSPALRRRESHLPMKTRTHFAHRIDMLDTTGEIRRALELLASCRDGCTEAMTLAHGFTIPQMVELIRAGLASASAERLVAGGRTIEIARVRITDAGRRALAQCRA
jgi:hypothetical protein